ncbi:DUF424 family protein [Candidatus Micrarchaeota archaeon]|nr:DUF424 family protein [Candidatus Micrarchaeota archaeon]
MYIKINERDGKRIIGICDKELIGKILKEREVEMDLSAHKGFFVGRVVRKSEVVGELEVFDSVVAVGVKVVGIIKELGLADEGAVQYINSVPYIQLYRF